jgi:hypothetical protein
MFLAPIKIFISVTVRGGVCCDASKEALSRQQSAKPKTELAGDPGAETSANLFDETAAQCATRIAPAR